jgi:hypothetical protein
MDSVRDTRSLGWVAPFGDPRINDCSHLPAAYRSVPRPSSPLSAKASTRCPSTLDLVFSLAQQERHRAQRPRPRPDVGCRMTDVRKVAPTDIRHLASAIWRPSPPRIAVPLPQSNRSDRTASRAGPELAPGPAREAALPDRFTSQTRFTLSNNRRRPRGRLTAKPKPRSIPDLSRSSFRSRSPCQAPASPPRFLTSDICHPTSVWWRRTESNRRPHACKARALAD